MTLSPTLDLISAEALLDRVRAEHRQGKRLVQISATRLAEHVELTYSFDLEGALTNLRLTIPAAGARVRSISSVYACAFLYENEMHDLFGLEVDGMSVDFHGKFYQTSVQFPFSSFKAPPSKAAVTAETPAVEPAAPGASTRAK